MMICIVRDWWRLALGMWVAMVAGGLYAGVLCTKLGREVCEKRTEWTVIGGHLLMVMTMALVSWEAALLFLVWSVASGLPMVVRSAVLRWMDDRRRWEAAEAALKALARHEAGGQAGEARGDCGD